MPGTRSPSARPLGARLRRAPLRGTQLLGAKLQSTLQYLRPQRIPLRHLAQRSAVAIITRQGPSGEEVLLIERATRVGDPWSGHMAFPGGKQQTGDISIRDTAIRETQEEIGLNLTQDAHFLGRSSDLITRRHNALKPMIVTPYRFRLINSVTTFNSNHEVANIVWVPLDFLRNKHNQSTLTWAPLAERKNNHTLSKLLASVSVQLPCYYYQGHCIWGLTYQMLTDQLEFPKATEK